MASYIVGWLQDDEARSLVLVGDGTGRTTVVREASYRAGRMFLQDPERVRPLLTEERKFGAVIAVGLRDWVCRMMHASAGAINQRRRASKTVFIHHVIRGFSVQVDESSFVTGQLIPPADEDLLTWYRDHLSPSQGQALVEAFHHSSELAALLREPQLLRGWAQALSLSPLRVDEPLSVRVAHALVAFFEHAWRRGADSLAVFSRGQLAAMDNVIESSGALLEDAALEHFALQRGVRFHDVSPDELESLQLIGIRYDAEGSLFTNFLVRDYFLARKIIREVQAGHRDILTRYLFPREYVLLFLAVLSPEVSAFASQDQSDALRTEIEQQAEQEVQLVLAHHLKRSVGAIQTQMEALQEHLPRELAPEAQRALHRVEAELDYLRRLADRTRRLHQVPSVELLDVPLGEVLEAALDHLRSTMPQVNCELQVEAGVAVRGNRDSLEEILSCLLENAFHAVAFDRPEPRVRVAVIDEGATVRVDLADNGPGVRAEDRARIFDPRVTTKKGGEGRPIGTGMGLPIARKYAEAIGGRVDLDPERPETTFYVRLVKARGGESW
jgi:signal transduction histidine kinase